MRHIETTSARTRKMETPSLDTFHDSDSMSTGRDERSGHFLSQDESADENSDLCLACRRIDFKKVLDIDPSALRNKDGIVIASLDHFLESCALCRIFAAALGPLRDTGPMMELRAFSILRQNPKIDWLRCPSSLKSKDQPYLIIVHKDSAVSTSKGFDAFGQIFCQNEGDTQTKIFSPQFISSQLEYSNIQRWLEYCKLHPYRLCQIGEQQISGLKVIDCSSLSVVATPPSCLYVSLSYVWGQSRTVEDDDEFTLNGPLESRGTRLPQTIKDAITVTVGLGFQYLWVDRLCIDQNNEGEKHDQFRQMDSIYNGAELCLVAVAGVDGNFGLPGVSRPRKGQLTTNIGDIQLFCTTIHPHTAIENSKWSTRGWTYQEAVLSRRRLVFTEEQVYFECNAMNCYESLRGDLDLLHAKKKFKSLAFLHNGILAGREREPFGASDGHTQSLLGNQIRYLQLIENYTARDLTYDGDSLHAFAGIARQVAKSKFPVFHISGLPAPFSFSPEENRRNLAFALIWVHLFCHNSRLKAPYRRREFASWSWAGWAGGIQFMLSPKDWLESPILNVYFEFEGGRLVEHSQLLEDLRSSKLAYSTPRALRLNTRVVPWYEVSYERTQRREEIWTIGNYPAIAYYPERKSAARMTHLSATEQWKLIEIGTTSFKSESRRFFMLTEQWRTTSATRVGIFVIKGSQYGFYSLDQFPRQDIRPV